MGAVAITNVDTQFIQRDASCTMSSYAIVANYFTGEPVSAYFEGYCDHFGLFYVGPLQAERKYARHLRLVPHCRTEGAGPNPGLRAICSEVTSKL